MEVPFVNLRPQHAEIRGELTEAFTHIVETSSFIGGAWVERFEQAFAAYCGVPQAVGVGSGTDAVRIALQLAGVRRDDVVITVSNSFIATAEAVTQLGAEPLFVDVDRASQTMSPAALAALLGNGCDRRGGALVHRATGRRVAALLPVHLYGQSAEMAPLLELGSEFGVPVVEDACQAHGALYRFPDGSVRRCGTMGVTAAFSFYPGKNLGAMGEAGAVTTADPDLAARARVLRDHGQSARYVHVTAEGGNARLDALQAAVLTLKLARLDDWNAARRRLAAVYDHRLGGASLTKPVEMPYARHVWHLYVVRVRDRDAVRAELAKRGVATALHYPIPIHRQEAYAHLGLPPGSLPETEAAASELLSLPMYPHMTEDMAAYVTEQLLTVMGE